MLFGVSICLLAESVPVCQLHQRHAETVLSAALVLCGLVSADHCLQIMLNKLHLCRPGC